MFDWCYGLKIQEDIPPTDLNRIIPFHWLVHASWGWQQTLP